MPIEPGDNPALAQPDDAAPAQSAGVVDAVASEDIPARDRFKVTVSDDHLSAWVQWGDANDEAPVEIEDVLAALDDTQIVMTDDVERRIGAFVDAIAGGGERSERFLIAEGSPAVESENGEFILEEGLRQVQAQWQEDAQIDHYAFNSVVTVDAGATIGRIVPPTQGQDGLDICGQALKPKRRPTEVMLGNDLHIAGGESGTVIADVAGKISYKLGRLSIDKTLDIRGDIDFDSGSVDSNIDVHIKGDVLDGFTVKSNQSITVGGVIGAATVEAGGDVIVRGGILNRHKGTVTAGGDIVARFGEEAALQSDQDVVIGKELMNSEVRCRGHVLASHGEVIGGHTYARKGVDLRCIGSEAEIPTSIAVGIPPDAYFETARIEAKQLALKKLERVFKLLKAKADRSSPSQQERAAKLMSGIGSATAAIAAAERHRDELIESGATDDEPFVLVAKTIYPSVRIRIDQKETLFKREFNGPARIERRKVRSATEFVAVNQLTGSITVLPSADVADEDCYQINETQP